MRCCYNRKVNGTDGKKEDSKIVGLCINAAVVLQVTRVMRVDDISFTVLRHRYIQFDRASDEMNKERQ